MTSDLLDKVKTLLVVVVDDVRPVDALLLVLFLLLPKKVRVEVVLQLLVRVVDAELFERVRLRDTSFR
jgi:hypothetical protein